MRRRETTRIGIRELGPHNFDLLPLLYRDRGTSVRWVEVGSPEEPLARLAGLLGFPLVSRGDVGRAARSREAVDCVLVRRLTPYLRRALGSEGIDWSRVCSAAASTERAEEREP